jgi:hypothetical protein
MLMMKLSSYSSNTSELKSVHSNLSIVAAVDRAETYPVLNGLGVGLPLLEFIDAEIHVIVAWDWGFRNRNKHKRIISRTSIAEFGFRNDYLVNRFRKISWKWYVLILVSVAFVIPRGTASRNTALLFRWLTRRILIIWMFFSMFAFDAVRERFEVSFDMLGLIFPLFAQSDS